MYDKYHPGFISVRCPVPPPPPLPSLHTVQVGMIRKLRGANFPVCTYTVVCSMYMGEEFLAGERGGGRVPEFPRSRRGWSDVPRMDGTG
jgi:hypothetical protein